jgi:hypothetical protein
MPDERYSDDDPDRGRRYSDEPDRGRRSDSDYEGRRYDDRDFRTGEEVPNYLVQSILVTLCCCLPFGIVAIVNASKVSSLVQAGNYEAARQASEEAKKWCTIGFVCGLIGTALWVGVQIMLGAAGGMR